MLIMSGLAGCGGKDKDSDDTGKATSSEKEKDDEDEDKDNKDDDGSGGIKIDLGKSGTNLKLPKDFPKDVVPLIKDANIVNVIDNKNAMAMGVTYVTEKDLEYAVEFYQDVLKDGQNYSVTEVSGGTILYALKEGYGVSATIVEYDGDKVSIMLNVAFNKKDDNDNPSEEPSEDPSDEPSIEPGDAPIEEPSEDPQQEDYFKNLEEVDLPDEYQKDKYPVFSGDKVNEAIASEDDSETIIYLSVVSEKSLKEIVDYYEKSWGTLTDKSKTVSTNEFYLQGYLDGNLILVTGSYDSEIKVVKYMLTIYEYKKTAE
jgi:hypothetical protein